MQPDVKVSVIMSVHNGESYLNLSVPSILEQEFEDFEFLIVDDGSSDGSVKLIESFQDPRIILIRKSVKQGLTRALNEALGLSRGQYVARQDVDDVSKKDRLRKQTEFLNSNPEVVLVGSAVQGITEDGTSFRDYSYPCDHEGLVSQLYQLLTPLPHSTVMFRRKEVLGCGGYRETFVKAQDYDLLLRLSERFYLASLPDQLCQIRVSVQSITFDESTGSQFKYGVLAFVTALMRKLYGIDPLHHPHREEFLIQFEQWYCSSVYPRIFSSRQWRRRAHIALVRQEYRKSFIYFLKSFQNDPMWITTHLKLPFYNLVSQACAWAHHYMKNNLLV